MKKFDIYKSYTKNKIIIFIFIFAHELNIIILRPLITWVIYINLHIIIFDKSEKWLKVGHMTS